MIRNILKFVIPAVGLLLVGCRTPTPINDIAAAPVTTPRPATLQEIERAIRTAGAGLGWQMVPRGPGKVEGTINLREHRAVVDISFDAKNYSIKYKDSSNLNYDGKSIHPQYNNWIINLDRAIRAQLSAL